MNRRNFLSNSFWLAGALAVGCGASGTGSFPSFDGTTTAPMSSGPISGRVVLSEIGGRSLQVLSAFSSSPTPVDANGTFNTQAAQSQAQLLMVTDSARKLRALALSQPGQEISFGAVSTALMLCFMTRGIATSDPQQAAQRLDEIQALASFIPLLSFLRSRLLAQGLDFIVADADYAGLLQAVVAEWARLHFSQSRVDPVDPIILNGFVGLSYDADQANQLNLQNTKFRYVSVVHQDLDTNGDFLDSPYKPVIQNVANTASQRNLLPSAIGLSFGDIATASVGQPTEGFESLNLADKPGVREIGYYIYGPGLASLGQPSFPPEVEELLLDSKAFSFTVFFLGLGPLLNLVAPVSRNMSEFLHELADALSAGAGAGLDSDSLVLAYSGGNTTDISAAWVNFLTTAVGLGLGLISAGPLAAGAALVTTVLGSIGVGFGLANLSLVIDTTTKLPMRQVVKIAAPTRQLQFVAVESYPVGTFPFSGDGGHLAVMTGTDGAQVAPRVSWKRRRGSEQLISASALIQGGLRPMNVDGHLLWSNYSFPPGRYEDFQLWDGSNSYPLPASPEAVRNIYGISDSGWVIYELQTGSSTAEVHIWKKGMLQSRVLIPSYQLTGNADFIDWSREIFVRQRTDAHGSQVFSTRDYKLPVGEQGDLESEDNLLLANTRIQAINNGVAVLVTNDSSQTEFLRADGSRFTVSSPPEATWFFHSASTDAQYILFHEYPSGTQETNLVVWSNGQVVGEIENAVASFSWAVSRFPQVTATQGNETKVFEPLVV